MATSALQCHVVLGTTVNCSDRGQTASIVLQEPVPKFDVSGLDAPDEATIGDQATVRATVSNTGTRAGSPMVEYRLGGRVLASQSVSLNPGQSRTVTLEPRFTDYAAGSYTQGVYIRSTNQGQTLTLTLEGVAAFDVANLQAPASVIQEDRVTVEAQIRNSGTASGRASVQYRVGQEVRDTKQVTLKPGERTTVSFDVRVRNEPGTYRHGVFIGESDRGQTSSLVVVSGEPRYVVGDFEGPAEVMVGDEVTVEATVTNTGNGEGSTSIEYRIRGDRVASQSVSLAAGAQTDVSFTVRVPELAPGTYRHGVFIGSTNRGQTSGLVIAAAPTPTAAPGLIGFDFVIGVLALIVVALVLARRRA